MPDEPETRRWDMLAGDRNMTKTIFAAGVITAFWAAMPAIGAANCVEPLRKYNEALSAANEIAKQTQGISRLLADKRLQDMTINEINSIKAHFFDASVVAQGVLIQVIATDPVCFEGQAQKDQLSKVWTENAAKVKKANDDWQRAVEVLIEDLRSPIPRRTK